MIIDLCSGIGRFESTNEEVISIDINPKVKLVTQKYVKFHGKPVRLDHNPRTGICSNCKRSIHTGEIKVTNLHHDEYDESNPLAHTRELCVRCHRQLHAQLRRRN